MYGKWRLYKYRWCGDTLTYLQHFIGNRAIELGNGEPELQIAYSSRFTALSFFIPILVLLAAFVAIGAKNRVSWWRVSGGYVPVLNLKKSSHPLSVLRHEQKANIGCQ